MAKRWALITLATTSPLLLICCFVDEPAAGWIAALLAVVQPVALTALGACRQGSLGPLRLLIPLILVWYLVVMSALLLLDGSRMTLAGVPLPALLMLAGLWLVPMVLVTVAYTKSFSQFALTDEDLDRIRRFRADAGFDSTSR